MRLIQIMNRNNTGSISFGSVMIWFGLFILVILPFMLIVINREHNDVKKIIREELIRGYEIQKDSLLNLNYKLNKRDSTIVVLEYKVKKQNKKIDSLLNTIKTMQMSGSIKNNKVAK